MDIPVFYLADVEVGFRKPLIEGELNSAVRKGSEKFKASGEDVLYVDFGEVADKSLTNRIGGHGNLKMQVIPIHVHKYTSFIHG